MTKFLMLLTRHPVSLIGSAITTASGMLFLILFGMSLSGFQAGPYIGILAFMVIPGFFVFGLVLIPTGVWLDRRRRRRQAETAEGPFPVLDLNREAARRGVLLFVAATVVNIGIVAVATYKGVEVMDSTAFCGQACHSVMAPEFTTYGRSPHARVKCVECHIGPGADWFVKSKLSGSWQVVSVAFDLYPRPIPTPVHNLRPARETCEQCHWPDKFVGDRLKVITRYQEDETNTPLKTVLLLRVGGVQGRASHGIHWHVDPNIRIRYTSDETRETIHAVELTTPDGKTATFLEEGAEAPGPDAQWRVMDCIDCHNRPTHIYRLPGNELDSALEAGRIDASLPFVKREGLRLLKTEWASHDEARTRIPAELQAFYEQQYPEVAKDKAEDIARAGRQVATIWTTNVWPSMNITWGTYPSHIGHQDYPGCFRCHDESHTDAAGDTIPQDCDTCHSLLAMEEESPAILKELNP